MFKEGSLFVMKKSDIALIVGVIIVFIIGGFVMKGTKTKVNYVLPLSLSGEVGLQKLSYSEYQKKIDDFFMNALGIQAQ